MVLLFYTILILCTHNVNGAVKEIFDRNVDDIFESVLGDPHEVKRKMIERGRTYKWYKQTLPPNISAIFNSDISLNHTYIDEIITTTTQKHIPITPAPDEENYQNINTSMSYYKFRLKKLEIRRLLKETGSPLPNFAKDQDNPAHITKRFDKLVTESGQTDTLFRRELYFDYQMKNKEHVRIYAIKTKMRDIIAHFVYVTRYKLPYMQLLRKKYKGLLKYKIGYCFALLRHLRQQQKNIYSALLDYYKMMNNLMVHLKIYEKIVRLDVDIRDVCKLVKVLNYKRQLEDDSTYYDDSPENTDPPPASMGGPRGQGPSAINPRSKEQSGSQYPGNENVELPTGQLSPASRRALIADTPKATSLARKSIKSTILAQSAIRADTPDTVNKRNVQPPKHGYQMPADQKPYDIQELEIKRMSPMTQPPQLLKNGRRIYAPLPDGMSL